MICDLIKQRELIDLIQTLYSSKLYNILRKCYLTIKSCSKGLI